MLVSRAWVDRAKAKAAHSRSGGLWPHTPTSKQQEALDSAAFWLLYGGAAAGGKSDWVLMDASRYVEHANYRAIIFRRTYAQLAALGGLIERSKQWWMGKAVWNGGRATWTFPSGAEVGFKHIQHEDDKYDLNSIEIHRAYLEECNQFTESQARYVMSRVRKNVGDDIPLAVRMTSNPGGHDWVKRFVMECRDDPAAAAAGGKAFIPARLDDNPHVNQEEYRSALSQLDSVTRAQLLHGDWDVGVEGGMIRREGFRILDALPPVVRDRARWLRYWDMAATAAAPGKDPDYSVGLKMGLHDGNVYIPMNEMQRFQLAPADGDARVVHTAQVDGRFVQIRMEEEGGSSGKRVTKYFERALMGFDFRGVRKTGSKVEEARPFAAAVEQGRVYLIRGEALGDYLTELEGFPIASHDDMVDASSGAFNELMADSMMGQAETVSRTRNSRNLRKEM